MAVRPHRGPQFIVLVVVEAAGPRIAQRASVERGRRRGGRGGSFLPLLRRIGGSRGSHRHHHGCSGKDNEPSAKHGNRPLTAWRGGTLTAISARNHHMSSRLEHMRENCSRSATAACGSSYDLPTVPRAARTCNALLDDLVGTTGLGCCALAPGGQATAAPTATVAHSDGRDERRRRRRGWTSSALRGPCSIRRARPSRAVARHVRQGNSGANQ